MAPGDPRVLDFLATPRPRPRPGASAARGFAAAAANPGTIGVAWGPGAQVRQRRAALFSRRDRGAADNTGGFYARSWTLLHHPRAEDIEALRQRRLLRLKRTARCSTMALRERFPRALPACRSTRRSTTPRLTATRAMRARNSEEKRGRSERGEQAAFVAAIRHAFMRCCRRRACPIGLCACLARTTPRRDERRQPSLHRDGCAVAGDDEV